MPGRHRRWRPNSQETAVLLAEMLHEPIELMMRDAAITEKGTGTFIYFPPKCSGSDDVFYGRRPKIALHLSLWLVPGGPWYGSVRTHHGIKPVTQTQ